MTFPGVLKCCFQKRRDNSRGLHNTNHKVTEVYSQKFHLSLHPCTSIIYRSFSERSPRTKRKKSAVDLEIYVKYFTLSTCGTCAKAFCKMNQASVLSHTVTLWRCSHSGGIISIPCLLLESLVPNSLFCFVGVGAGSPSVAQTGFRFIAILLPLLPKH